MVVEETSKQYLTTNTHKSHSGLKQHHLYGSCRAMEHTLQRIPNVVTGKSDAAHLDNLEAVIKRLAEKNLRINVQKCRFFLDRIEYCGHAIAKYGLHEANA